VSLKQDSVFGIYRSEYKNPNAAPWKLLVVPILNDDEWSGNPPVGRESRNVT